MAEKMTTASLIPRDPGVMDASPAYILNGVMRKDFAKEKFAPIALNERNIKKIQTNEIRKCIPNRATRSL